MRMGKTGGTAQHRSVGSLALLVQAFVCLCLSLGVVLGCGIPLAGALELPELSGFATFGIQHLDDEGRYVGMEQQTSIESASVLGLQLRQSLSRQFDATLQLQAAGRDDFDPELEWAYLAWHVTPAVTLRGGRLAMQVYQASDYLYVGHALPWAAPPYEVYGTTNLQSWHEGAEVLWRFRAAGSDFLLQAMAGELPFQAGFVQGRVNSAMGLALQMNRGDLELRLGAFTGEVRMADSEQDRLYALPAAVGGGSLIDLLDAVGAAGLAQDLRLTGQPVRFYSAAFYWHPGHWRLQGEYVLRSSDLPLLPQQQAAYLLLGYRLGAWTPYALVAEMDTETERLSARLPAALATDNPAVYGLLDQGLTSFTSYLQFRQRSFGLGLRWDLREDLALKADWRQIQRLDGSVGGFIEPPADAHSQLFTLTLDWVF